MLSGVQLSAPPQVEVQDCSARDRLREAGPAQLDSGFAVAPQRARVVPRSGGPFSQNTGVAGVVQGIRLSVRAGHALIAADDDWDEEAQAQTLQSLGLARSDAGESAPLRVLEPSRCPERGSS